MRKPQSSKKRKQIHKTYLYLKKNVFFCVLFLIAIIGLLIPLRPKTSAVENRTLTTFPKFSLSSLWNGEFFSGISTWYSDTFPFREALLSANSGFQSLYGIQGEQLIHNSNQTGDEIPEGGTLVPAESSDESTPDSAAESTSGGVSESTDTQTDTSQTDETFEDGAIHDVPEMSGNVYVTGDTAFGIYYFNLEGANDYIKMLDSRALRRSA